MSEVQITNAVPEMLDQVLVMLKELYHGDTGAGLRSLVHQFVVDDEVCTLVAKDDDHPVGFLAGTHRLEIDFECRAAIIEAVIVNESHRGKGIGRAFLQRFSDWANSRGCQGILVPAGREGFFDAIGFEGYSAKRYWKALS